MKRKREMEKNRRNEEEEQKGRGRTKRQKEERSGDSGEKREGSQEGESVGPSLSRGLWRGKLHHDGHVRCERERQGRGDDATRGATPRQLSALEVLQASLATDFLRRNELFSALHLIISVTPNRHTT